MQYQSTPFKEHIKLLVSGRNSYLYGSYTDKVSPTFGYVLSNSSIGTVGSVVFQIRDGNPPIVGALITVRGTENSGGVFNVVNAIILSAVTNTDTGVSTVTYAVASTTQASAADNGQVDVPQPEIGETLVNGSSAPVAMPFQNAQMGQGKDLVAVVSFPTIPTTAVVTLQSALIDLDAEYADIVTVASITGSVVTGGQVSVGDMAARFYRFHTTGLTGVGTIIGKLNG